MVKIGVNLRNLSQNLNRGSLPLFGPPGTPNRYAVWCLISLCYIGLSIYLGLLCVCTFCLFYRAMLRPSVRPCPCPLAVLGPRPHYESSFSMQICYPLSRLCLQASVPSMKWHCLSTLFLVFLFLFPAGKVPLRDLSSPLMIWPKYLNFLLFTFASKLLLTPACSKTHEFYAPQVWCVKGGSGKPGIRAHGNAVV